MSAPDGWYVVWTKPNAEHTVESHLKRQNFRTYLPVLSRAIKHARKTTFVEKPLFACYLFTELNLKTERWRSINSTYGVRSLLMAGERPLPVPNELVKVLMQRQIERESSERTIDFEVGAKVRISSGPFAEAIATVYRLESKGRVAVLMELLGVTVRASLGHEAVGRL